MGVDGIRSLSCCRGTGNRGDWQKHDRRESCTWDAGKIRDCGVAKSLQFAAVSRSPVKPAEISGSDKYVVIRYSLAQNIVVMMNKIPNSTNMVF